MRIITGKFMSLLNATLASFLFFVINAQAQDLEFTFNGTFDESQASVQPLNVLGTGNFITDTIQNLSCIPRTVYHFNTNSGVQFDNNASGNFMSANYSVELYFSFDSDAGFRRILDFNNQTADSGLYSTSGSVQFYDAITINNPIFSGGNYGHLVLTRDSVTEEVSIFLNGMLGGVFLDTGQIATLDTSGVLNLFQDDLVFGGEASSGNIALFSVYNAVLSMQEVSDRYDQLRSALDLISFQVNTTGQCEGSNNFEFVNLSDSIISYTYYWNLGDGTITSDTSAVHSYSAAGTYTVYLVSDDGIGCIDSLGIPVNVYALPSPALSSVSPVCPGDSVTISSPTGFISYIWNTLDTTSAVTVSSPGDYWVTVVDTNQCAGNSDTVTVSNLTPPFVELGSDTLICGGVASIDLDAGPNGISYVWNTGDSTQVITVAMAGSYSVIVTDSAGCSTTDSINVSLTPLVDLGADIQLCSGDSVVLDAGPDADTYAWNTGWTGQSLVVSTTGMYTVTVTDTVQGCVNTDSMMVTVNNLPQVNLGPDFSACDNQPIPLDAGAGFISYLWNTGQTTQVINADSSSIYIVTVTDSLTCANSDTVDVTVLLAPVISFTGGPFFCFDDTVLLDGGAGFVSYLWNTGQTTQAISTDTSGTYILTVSATNGCNATDSIALIELPPVPQPVITQNGNTLSSTLSAAYQWFVVPGGAIAGANGQDYSPTQNGLYYVTVTDTNGCESIPSDTINFILSGLSETAAQVVSIAPNPAANEFRLMISPVYIQELHVRVYDVLGQVVLEAYRQSAFNIRDLNAGVYLVRVDSGDLSRTIRLVVDR